MLERLRRLLRSENLRIFSEGVAIQFLGYAISLALLPIAIAFYTPEQFGVLAVVLFVANFIGTFGGARLEWAVINEQSNKIAELLMRFALTLLIVWGVATLFICLILPDSAYAPFHVDRGTMLLAAPTAVAVGFGIFQQAWGIRKKAFRDVYLTRNTVMVSRQIVQIGLGAVWPSSYALLLSELISRALGVQLMLQRMAERLTFLPPFRFLRQFRRVLASRYGHYSAVALPSSIVGWAMTESLPVAFVLLHGPDTGGAFWLVLRTLGAPIALIGNVAADIFQGQIARQVDYRQTYRQIRQVAALLLAFSVVVMPVVGILFWLLTQHLYDGRWMLSGEIALYMLPAVCLQFIASPLSRVLIVRKKMQYKLVFDATLFLGLSSWFMLTEFLNLTFFQSVAYLSAAQALAYGVYILLSFLVAKQDAKNAG